MQTQQVVRARPVDSQGAATKLLFEGRMTVPSGAVTTIAAATATAGHLFAMRWAPATAGALCLIRYVRATFVCTTAFGGAQNMGLDLVVARTYSVSDTAGTAIDMGSTTANTGATRTANGTSLFGANTCRVATAAALTAGTHALDINSYYQAQGFVTTTLGATSSLDFTLLDARDDGAGAQVRSPITLANNEGIKLRNTILMGATGVGSWLFTVEWDEVTL